MAYTLPSDVDARPVAVIGGGTLGRRIAAMFAAGGTDVHVFDLSADQRAAAVDFATRQAPGIRQKLDITAPRTGTVEAAADLAQAVDRAWLVIEAVPEKRDLKIEVFGTLDRLAAADAILASNSSSFANSELIDKVEHVGLDVVLDIEEHYAAARAGIPKGPRTLLREYIAQGRLGVKTGRGFYDESQAKES